MYGTNLVDTVLVSQQDADLRGGRALARRFRDQLNDLRAAQACS